MILTQEQRKALKRVYDRKAQPEESYRDFRRSVVPGLACDPVIMVPFAGMWLGIEPDGYTHS